MAHGVIGEALRAVSAFRPRLPFPPCRSVKYTRRDSCSFPIAPGGRAVVPPDDAPGSPPPAGCGGRDGLGRRPRHGAVHPGDAHRPPASARRPPRGSGLVAGGALRPLRPELPGRGRGAEPGHGRARPLRRPLPVRGRGVPRRPPRARPPPAGAPRQDAVLGHRLHRHRLEPRPPHGLLLHPQRGRSPGGRHLLRGRHLHLHLGRRLGRGRGHAGRRVVGRVRPPALHAPLRGGAGTGLGLRRVARDRAHARDGRDGAHSPQRPRPRLPPRPPHRPRRPGPRERRAARAVRRREARPPAAVPVLGSVPGRPAHPRPHAGHGARPALGALALDGPLRHREPGLRPGGGRRDRPEPDHLRALLPGEAPLLQPGARPLRSRRVHGRAARAAAAVLLAPHRPRDPHPRRGQAHRAHLGLAAGRAPRRARRGGRPAPGVQRGQPRPERALPLGAAAARRSHRLVPARGPRHRELLRRRGPLAGHGLGHPRRDAHLRHPHGRDLHGGRSPVQPHARPLPRLGRPRRRARLEPAHAGQRVDLLRPGGRVAGRGRAAGADPSRRHRAPPRGPRRRTATPR